MELRPGWSKVAQTASSPVRSMRQTATADRIGALNPMGHADAGCGDHEDRALPGLGGDGDGHRGRRD